jgi:uncharacterized membrane protein
VTVNELVNAAMFALNVWWIVKIAIGLVQPAQPKRKRRGSWTQDEARGVKTK